LAQSIGESIELGAQGTEEERGFPKSQEGIDQLQGEAKLWSK
jgi:hypothetical protein